MPTPPAMTRRQSIAALALLPALAAQSAARTTPVANADDAGAEQFGLDLYAELAKKPGNVVCSPLSVRTILALTAAGAGGATRGEMISALKLPGSVEASDATVSALMAQLNAPKGFALSVANALWVMRGFPLRPEFVTRAKTSYSAEARECDFVADPAGSRTTINRWVESKTNDKIKDLIPASAIDADTRLVLTNAAYFKADWQTPFPKPRTAPGPFTLPGGATKQVPLMHLSAELMAGDDPAESFQTVRLPYAGGQVSMVVLVPRKPDGLPALEAGLSAERFRARLAGLKSHRVELTLPKFRAEFEATLNGPLQSLGMRAAFTPSADFSKLTSADKLMISLVVHKAFIEVDEAGTEAAAATGVVMTRASARLPAPPLTVTADRSFLYAIRHEPTGRVLFWGRYCGE